MFPQSSRTFEPLTKRLAKSVRVLAPDVPGFGESAALPCHPSVDDYAAALWKAIDAADEPGRERSVNLFGIHAGAKLVVRMAVQRPEQVCGLMLSSPAVFETSELQTRKERRTLIALDKNGTRFEHLWRNLVKYANDTVPLDELAEYFAEMVRAGDNYIVGHGALDDYNAMFCNDLQRIGVPVLVLNPQDELYSFTPRAMEYLADAKLIDLPLWSFGYLKRNARELAQLLADNLR